MAMLSDIDDHGLSPAEQEVAHASSQRHGDAEVGVVGHEHQHQNVADGHLYDVQKRLQKMGRTQHPLPKKIGEHKHFNTYFFAHSLRFITKTFIVQCE